jgi:hypothetical protein
MLPGVGGGEGRLGPSHALFDEAISKAKNIASDQYHALALKEISEALASCGYYKKTNKSLGQ